MACDDVRLELGRAGSGGARRRDAAPRVHAEFVYADRGARAAVALCGDWNGWAPIAMRREAAGVWCVVTVVPAGYREFCYLVDGVHRVSRRHPRNADASANWRTVNGPPGSCGAAHRAHRFVLLRAADAAAHRLRVLLLRLRATCDPPSWPAPRKRWRAALECALRGCVVLALFVTCIMLFRINSG